MQNFMSEEEAVAILDERMEDIVARMASGTNASSSQANASNSSGTFTQPCNGTCIDDVCCNCCVC